MDIRKTIAEICYPEIFEISAGLETDLKQAESELGALEIELAELAEQVAALEEEKNKQPIDDGSPQPTTLNETPLLNPPTESNKPSAGSSVEYAKAVQAAKSVAAVVGAPRIAFVANTNSMEPHIDANSVVILELVNPANLSVGDIVSYKGEGSIYQHFKGKEILHRVTAISGNLYRIKGDNNFKDDGWIKAEFITHRYVGQINFKKTDLSD